MGKSLADKGKTTSQGQEKSAGKPRSRRLATLGAIRRELVRLYAELKDLKASQSKAKVQYYRALCFILSAAADVMKSEKMELIEQRLEELEKAAGK